MFKNKIQALAILSAAGLAIFAFGLYSTLDDEEDAKHLTLYGNVDVRQATVGFRVGGKLLAVHCEEGDLVEEGQLLASIDPAVYQMQLVQTNARLLALEAEIEKQKLQIARREGLIASRSVSEEEFESMLLNLRSLEQQAEEAKAALAEAALRVSDTELHAVQDGVVLSRIEEPGTVINVGQPVLAVSIPKPLWVRTFVSEPDLGRIHPGMKAVVVTDTPSNPVYEGQVGFISPVAEFTPKSVQTTDLRTDLVYQVRIIVPHADQGLRQGMPVTVKIEL
ncbi:MAG: efflux RND transporter periplasmic adaptor subunit [Chlamydiia bacterium]|nr:efflux RND transporter periplasmic adaptor subunit [Chlamydiia bacterium]